MRVLRACAARIRTLPFLLLHTLEKEFRMHTSYRASTGSAHAREPLARIALSLLRLALLGLLPTLLDTSLAALSVLVVKRLATRASRGALPPRALVALFSSREVPVAARALPILCRVNVWRSVEAGASHRAGFGSFSVAHERFGLVAPLALVPLREVAVRAVQTDPFGWLIDRIGLWHDPRLFATVVARRPPAS